METFLYLHFYSLDVFLQMKDLGRFLSAYNMEILVCNLKEKIKTSHY